MEALGLYVHIPFCHRKCGYCDFNSYAMSGAIVPAFVEALHREIEQCPYGGARVTTLFFGGGTPTFLEGETLAQILEHLQRRFDIAPDAEITIEANPGSVDRRKLRILHQAGFNRLSLGVQSFDAEELKRMERIHSPSRGAAERIVGARGRLHQPQFGPHLCPARPDAGTLGVEPAPGDGAPTRTPLALRADAGTGHALPSPLSERSNCACLMTRCRSRCFAMAQQLTREAGYQQYEISNYALPGYACRHNLIYWHNRPYLGFGPGAVSFYGGRRWMNVKHPREYVRRIGAGEPLEIESEQLTGWHSVAETLMLGLRLIEGVNLAELERRYGLPVQARYQPLIQSLVARGWLLQEGTRIRLSDEGLLWHSEVAAQFLPL
jgi:oxygen-independent coproporphyrinogen III oxidase